jgi:hypothetical protein
MASDAPAFESGNSDGVALDLHAHDPRAFWYHNTFFLRCAQARDAQTDLMKSSAIKIAESRKLLAEVDALFEGKHCAMAIYRLLQNSAFGPDEINFMTTAYEDALRALGLTDRADPMTEILARKIIEIAQTGERDPARICAKAVATI